MLDRATINRWYLALCSCCFAYASQLFQDLENVLGCTRKYRCSWVTCPTVMCSHLNLGDSWLLEVQIEVTGSSCQSPTIQCKSIIKIFSTTLSSLSDTVGKLSGFHSLSACLSKHQEFHSGWCKIMFEVSFQHYFRVCGVNFREKWVRTERHFYHFLRSSSQSHGALISETQSELPEAGSADWSSHH